MSQVGESGTVKVARLALELRASGVDVMDLGVGEPDFPSPRASIQATQQALEQGYTKYTEAAGLKELRQAVAGCLARRYSAPWSAAEGIITVGAKMALANLAMALVGEGDEVVLSSPSWVSFGAQVRLAGATPRYVPTSADEGFRIQAEPILAAFGERTRAVLINSPANPTGGVIGGEDLARLAAACAERGIYLISDETYDRFVYPGVEFASASSLAARYPETIILVGSLSKTYAMTGWRLGYAFGPPEVVRALSTLQSHSTSNPTSFAMRGALAAIESGEEEVAAMIAEYEARRELVAAALESLPGFRCLPPAGAFYVFPHVAACYRAGRENSTAFAEFLLREAAVAVVPGAAFGADEHIRMSFACSRATLETAIERIRRALSA